MAHVRKQLRDAVALAVTGLTSTGSRVYESRSLPLSAAATELPALCVYARQDVPDYADAAMGARGTVLRVLELHVQGYYKAADGPGVEEGLDAIAEQVETAVFVDPTFGGKCIWTRLGPQVLDVDAEGDQTLGVIDMVFELLYRTAEGAPGTAI